MSKNHPDDNIYSILGKLKSLEPAPAEVIKEKAQAIRESVEAQGSIMSGVRTLEQTLNEKYMGFKAVEKAAKKGGAENPAAVAASIGRKKYGKAAFQKAAAAGKKMGEGELEESGLQYYTGKKKYGKDGMEALAKAGREGANQEELGRIKDKFIKKEQKGVTESNIPEPLNDDDLVNVIPRLYGMIYDQGDDALDYLDGNSPVFSQFWDKYEGDLDAIMNAPDVGYEELRAMYDELARAVDPHGVGPGVEEGAKVDRMVSHIKASEKKAGKSDKDAENIAWATVNKRGMLDNKNKKNECAMCEAGTCTEHNMEEGQLVPVKGGQVHKGHYGYEVDPNAEHTPKKKPVTGQRGRPAKEKPAAYSKMADPFGRISGKVPKGKGKIVPGARNDDTSRRPDLDAKFNADEKQARKAKRGLAESMALVESRVLLEANFRRMAEERHQSIEEMMKQMQDDMQRYKMTGECSEFLRDCMDLRSHHRQIELETVVPPTTAPVVPKPGILDRAKDLGQKALNKFGHPDDKEMLRDLERKTHPEPTIDEELNELARLAGLDVEEGNAFTGALKNTPKGGKFELDGKEYTDTSNLDEEPNEGNAFTGKLANTAKGDKFELDGKEYTDTSDLDEVMKLSGLPVKETVKVEEPKEKPANAPKEEYKSMRQSTMGPGEGDPGEKRMYPAHPAGDNGMAEPARKTPVKNGAVKEAIMAAEVAAEYESIKKVSR